MLPKASSKCLKKIHFLVSNLSLSLSRNRRRYLTIVGVSPADASASVACCCHIADAIACKKALVDQVSQQAHASCSVAIYVKNNVSDV